MRAYHQYVYNEARVCFEREMTEKEAAKRIDLGPYARWTEPERIIFNVARAYREFRGEPHDAPVDFFEMANVMAEMKQAQLMRARSKTRQTQERRRWEEA